MPMKSGDLRCPIDLMQPESARDERNRRETVYTAAAHVMAAKNDVSGREFYQAYGVHAEDIVTYTIRWKSGITTAWRVRDHGEDYNILEVNHLGYQRDYLRLKCRQVKRGGA